jgi:hypothetical protein
MCVRQVGPFVWWEAHPLAYKYVLLFFDLIEQPFSPFSIFQHGIRLGT